MARFRTLEEIIISMLNFANIAQPDANMAPGSVLRDLTVDMPGIEIAKIFDETRVKAGYQALLSAQGAEIDRWGANFGVSRLAGTQSAGTVVLTTDTLNSNISIAVNQIVTARGGQSFRIITDSVMDATKPALYRSVAVRYSTQLQLAGIFDQFAIEVPVQAVSIGTGGNIGKNQVTSHNIQGIGSVTNLNVFKGGTSIEGDVPYKNRLLAIFRGAATGTETAYLSTVGSDSRVISADVIGPGNTLMTRDGTVVKTAADGTSYVAVSGSGGKVDILVQGQDILTNDESFIYNDKSGRLDATAAANDYILGQRPTDSVLDFPQRRLKAQNDGLYPFQPVDEVLSIAGSLSGPNFVEATVDEFGNKTGNYELIKDDGAYSGSAFGFDKIHFISNEIQFPEEQISKPQLYSTDPLDFTDVQKISLVKQSVPILREVASVGVDRQFITLQHTPFFTVERVINQTTGERYKIVSSNPDGVLGELNTTGRVQISGATLPRSNDIIEASYSWQVEYDSNFDFDSLENPNRIRTALDSVDWGFGSVVQLEQTSTLFSVPDGYHLITEFPIAKVINVSTYVEESVVESNNKLVVAQNILNILSVLDSDGREVFFTQKNDGSVSGKTISLPSDSLLLAAGTAVVRYNTVDIFSPDSIDAGTFAGNKITLNDFIAPNTPVLVDYVVAYNELFSSTALLSLPATGSENEWVINGVISGAQPVASEWTAGIRGSLKRMSPSYIRFNFANLPNSGRLQIKGTVIKKVSGTFIYTGIDVGTVDLNSFIVSQLGRAAELINVTKFQKVQVSNGKIVNIQHEFDLQNYELANAKFSSSIQSALNSTSFELASTNANISAFPLSGQVCFVEAYVIYDDIERIQVSASGEQFSKNKYVFIEEIRVDSGFRNMSGIISGTITAYAFNQPQTNTQYLTDYNYTAPKVGERITVSYNYNSLLSDLVKLVDRTRPIGADVLIKEKAEYPVYVSASVAPLATYTGSTLSLQNAVIQRLTTFINQTTATQIDASDLINACYTVSGLDRIIITQLNSTGSAGVMQTIQSDKLSYFVTKAANVVIAAK